MLIAIWNFWASIGEDVANAFLQPLVDAEIKAVMAKIRRDYGRKP